MLDIPEVEALPHTQDGEAVIQARADELATVSVSAIRDWFRAQSKPWAAMTNTEQADLLHGIDKLVQDNIRQIVRVIAAEGRKVIVAKCEKVENAEKGIKATFSASKLSEHRHTLFDSQGLEVLIVVADPGEFSNNEKIEPDAPRSNQHDMFDGEDDDRPVFDSSANGQDVRAESAPRRRGR